MKTCILISITYIRLSEHLDLHNCVPTGRTQWFMPGTGLGNPAAVEVWTRKTVWFSSRPVQTPDPLLLSSANAYMYPSNSGGCRVSLELLVPISSSTCQDFLFMVTFRYATHNWNILTLVRHCNFELYWQSLHSYHAVTHSLHLAENEP